MHNFKKFALSLLSILALAACKPKYAPDTEALKQFETIKPGIEKAADGVMDEPRVLTGDINGDDKPDCVISYVLSPAGGGNMIIDEGQYIYLNTGSGMKEAGKIPAFKFCFRLDTITRGAIYIKKYKCEPPYNEGDGVGKLAYRNGKIVELY